MITTVTKEKLSGVIAFSVRRQLALGSVPESCFRFHLIWHG
jgi:hypothetical protein